METASRTPGRAFALALGLIALIPPLAVHLFLPVIPAVKAALNLTEARAQLTFSIALFGMAFVTLFYGALSDLRRSVNPPTDALVAAGDQGPKRDDRVQQYFSGVDYEHLGPPRGSAPPPPPQPRP